MTKAEQIELLTTDIPAWNQERPRHGDLVGADLSSANLRCADLRCSDLSNVNLRCADLSGAYLRGADLRYANLSGAVLAWTQRELIAEILRQSISGEMLEQQLLIAMIQGGACVDLCWDQYLQYVEDKPSLREWALSTLAPYVQEGDNAPPVLREYATKPRKVHEV